MPKPKDAKQQACAPSSLILACYFAPVRQALYVQGGLVNKLIYVVFIFLLSGCASTENESLGYNGKKKSSSESPGVLKTLENLKSNPDATFRNANGWTIINIDNDLEKSIYSFTPESHAAYPAIVKREIIEKDGSIHIEMTAKCGATKDVCDELVQQFVALNNKIRQSYQ